ncbi:MAG: chromate transporter [Bryobacteraceae bacterium]|nr:chromate transporter [Bryobacteraceae bacterium]
MIPEHRPTLSELAWLFFRIGNATFGSGGYILVQLRREAQERGWAPEWQLNLLLALARVVPGTNVFAFIAALAHSVRGWPGTVVALLATSVPASFVMVGLTLAYQRWNATPLGGPFITAAMSSIVGVILAAGWLLCAPSVSRRSWLRTFVLVFGGATLSLYIQPLAVLALAVLTGAFWPVPEERES